MLSLRTKRRKAGTIHFRKTLQALFVCLFVCLYLPCRKTDWKYNIEFSYILQLPVYIVSCTGHCSFPLPFPGIDNSCITALLCYFLLHFLSKLLSVSRPLWKGHRRCHKKWCIGTGNTDSWGSHRWNATIFPGLSNEPRQSCLGPMFLSVDVLQWWYWMVIPRL